MSIIYAGKTIVGPGNEIYVGENGNFWCGNRDLGVKARSDISIIKELEFNKKTEQGMYYVINDEDNSSINQWYIDETGKRYPVSTDKAIVPTVGANGNWFIGGVDTGNPSVITNTAVDKVLYVDDWSAVAGVSDLYVQTLTFVKLYKNDGVTIHVASPSDLSTLKTLTDAYNKLINYSVEDGCIKFYMPSIPTIDIPLTVSRIDETISDTGIRGAAINDSISGPDTAWSSKKITTEMTDLKRDIVSTVDTTRGKNLEFKWMGTELGVRQENTYEYLFTDLKGNMGLDGIDGSSVIDAQLDDNGHLLLTIQDNDESIETTKMLTLESGAFTGNDLLNIVNSINRLNGEIGTLKTAPLRQVYKMVSSVSNYQTLSTIYGCGNIQIFSTRFTGKVRITVDDNIYESEFTSSTNQTDNNIIVPSYYDNSVLMNSTFTEDHSIPLNISFTNLFRFEIYPYGNLQNNPLSILIQGNYFRNNEL